MASVHASFAPFRLRPEFRARPWGRRDLAPWYTAAETGVLHGETIGEAWLNAADSVVETGPLTGRTLQQLGAEQPEALLGAWQHEREFPLLLKLLFTEDKLSVQVHPDDEGARAAGHRRGKTECWYTLEAQPGATVALGWKPGTPPQQIEASIHNNTLEGLLDTKSPQPGDLFFVDAGTVHAIGPGLTLLETQQTCDVTYRLYDYGRPRELHIAEGMRAMRMQTDARRVAPQQHPHGTRLVSESHFTVDRLQISADSHTDVADAAGRPHALVLLSGAGILKSDSGEVDLAKGRAVIVPASCAEYHLHAGADGATVFRAMP